jgi:hypothetical protein
MPPLADAVRQDMDAAFWQRHGRAPTAFDIQMAQAAPMLRNELGRAPLRVEILQWLQGRAATSRQRKVFEVGKRQGGANPAPQEPAPLRFNPEVPLDTSNIEDKRS